MGIMMTTEFISMTVYATGGQWLASRISDGSGVMNANRVAASMLTIAALWVFWISGISQVLASNNYSKFLI